MANTIEMNVVATDEAPRSDHGRGEKVRFELNFMVMMLGVGRTKEANDAYIRLRDLANELD
jgi:hypothetical protein